MKNIPLMKSSTQQTFSSPIGIWMKFASIFTSKMPGLVHVVDWLYCVGWHDMQNDNAIRDTSGRTPCLSLSRDQNNFNNFYFGGSISKKANEKGQLFDTKDLQMVMRQIFWWGWTTNRERATTKLNVDPPACWERLHLILSGVFLGEFSELRILQKFLHD